MSTVVVTGSASGLGLVIAERLAADGDDLVLVDRDRSVLEEAADVLRGDHGVAVDTVVADLSTFGGTEAVAARLDGREDLVALVNNAGAWSAGAQFPDADADSWLATMTLDLLAPMLLTQRLWPALARHDGAVVMIGSSGGIGDEPYGSPEYGAAKAGLRRLTASLGGREDVRVMAVVPGWIGLERAHAELAALPEAEQRNRGPLVPPETVATTVADLVRRGRAGQVVDLLG